MEKKKKQKENPDSKKIKSKSETGAKATPIEINPELDSIRINEAVSGPAVFTFGRMNPPTSGHERLADKIESVAKEKGGMPHIFLSHSNDKNKNPLPYLDKIKLASKAFGKMVIRSRAKTVIDVMKELQKMGHKTAVMVVGSDRLKEFDTLLNKYNGKDYQFDKIEVVSAGVRDPDAEGAEGMSASKMRDLVKKNDRKGFKVGLPKKLRSNTISNMIFDMVQAGMELQEQLDLLDLNEARAPLTLQQRRKRAMLMRRYKSKIKRGREIAKRKMATTSKLATRAQRQAKQIVRKKVAGKRGTNYRNLSVADRMAVDKLVNRKADLIKKIAKRLMPKVKKAELERMKNSKAVKKESVNELSMKSPKGLPNLKIPTKTTDFERHKAIYKGNKKKPKRSMYRETDKKDINEQFESLFEVRQDPDIKDKKGTQPAKYHKGLAPSTKDKRDAQFKRQTKMADDDPKAYKPAPGDKEAKTKPSKYTKAYHKMYGEDYNTPAAAHKAEKTYPRFAALTDLDLNTKNRNETIKEYSYGPANPDNEEGSKLFWDRKAELWNAPLEQVKSMRCNNCNAFNQTEEVKKKMADALGPKGPVIVKNSMLGYCEFFEFKCAGSRTCDAWVGGGPITEQETAVDTTKEKHKQEKQRLKLKHDRELDRARLATARSKNREVTEENLYETVNHILDELMREEAYDLTEKSMEALKKKSEKSGISYGTLKKVYNRGVAAWKTGHRPGTTPQQWGYARVNAFITKKKKGNLNHDKDLAHYEPKGKMIESKTAELIRKSQAKRGAPGTLKRKIDGPITVAKVKALKNDPDATTLDKKQANFYLNMHDDTSEGLWDNIHKKRARGEKMRKKGEKGAPTPDQIKRAQEEKNPRIPRKKGQPAKSDKHSDLYTDENPKGTIQGLKFATVDDAEASVKKIDSSGKTHAHKIQAAVAMEQRAREMGKTSAANVYRKYINKMKEITKQKESLDSKDEPKINQIIKKLKGASKAHAGQAKDLEKAINEEFEDMLVECLQENGKCGCNPEEIEEAEVDGKKVKLNDPIRTSENPNKKFKVYVKDPSTGNIKVVRFGDPNLSIKRDDPNRRKSFRARHNCDNPGPKTKARYWSCFQWRGSAKVDN